MPRKPTGHPPGRPPGSGQLGLGVTDDQERLSIRIPRELYTRFEKFAAGRSFHRGSPQLARYVREAMEEYLARHTSRQTGNSTDASVHNDGRQKEEQPQPNTSGQTGSALPLFAGERPLDVLALDALVGPPPTLDALQVDWQANEQTAMDAVHATAPETLALMQALVDQDQAQAALVAAPPSTPEGPPQGDAADIGREWPDQTAPASPGSMYPVPATDPSPPDALPDAVQGKAALASRVRAMRLTMSHGKIARQLTAEGVPTLGKKPGAKWSNSAIERLEKFGV